MLNFSFSITSDSSLPSFCRPEYLEAQEDLELVWNCWNSLKGQKARYLHQEVKEPIEAYRDRLNRCAFDNRFSPAVAGYAGLLSDFTLLEDTAPSIIAAANNIDLQGNDIYTFWEECDTIALRDMWCGVLVEFPEDDNSIQSNADFLDSGRRPYLVTIDRRDILNWRVQYVSGRAVILQVTIQERRLEPEGLFGVKEQIYYRVLIPGGWAIYQIVESGGKSMAVLRAEGKTSLDVVPLICYSVSEIKPFQGTPPFLNLAHLNIEHLQKRSALNEILRKMCLPVPVRKGLIRTVADLKNAPPLVIGPNNVLDVPENGDFYFAEPSGSAIAETRLDLERLEATMDRISLAFLGGGETQRTATEVVLDSAQQQASLKGMARRKASAVNAVFELWIQYTDEATAGGIEIDESVLQMPITPEQVNRLESLARERFISHPTLLRELQAGKAISRAIDIEAEVAQSASE